MNRKERRVPLRDDQVITVLAPNNPKVEGSAAHDLFEQYRRPTMKVGAYLTAVAKLRRRGACGRSALWWDLDRGFIRIDDLGELTRGERTPHLRVETLARAYYPVRGPDRHDQWIRLKSTR
jgi:hypothetical protein